MFKLSIKRNLIIKFMTSLMMRLIKQTTSTSGTYQRIKKIRDGNKLINKIFYFDLQTVKKASQIDFTFSNIFEAQQKLCGLVRGTEVDRSFIWDAIVK